MLNGDDTKRVERENPWCIRLRVDDLMYCTMALYVLFQFHFVMCSMSHSVYCDLYASFFVAWLFKPANRVDSLMLYDACCYFNLTCFLLLLLFISLVQCSNSYTIATNESEKKPEPEWNSWKNVGAFTPIDHHRLENPHQQNTLMKLYILNAIYCIFTSTLQ